MKNASRLLAMLLAVAMFAAVAFTVSAFDDVNVEDDCYTAVNTLVSLNVIKGKTETEFAPDDAVTREQMAALMSRLYTTVAVEGGGNYTPFTDLDDPYYNSVISWCYDAGVINGTTPSTFEPKANIMLQDAVTMACRLIGYNDLTYPLGYLTKGRLIGLLDGLEDVAYDKELTRGETAILLYNTLDADGAEIISGSTVKWFYEDENDKENSAKYPLVVAYERNFTIALDVYKFKTVTFQVVGTENFQLDNYGYGSEDSFKLAAVDEKGDVSKKASTKSFEELLIAEDTNSDDYILTYIDILYKGDEFNDDAVILSTALVTNTDAKDEVGVYYKKNNAGKLVAQDNQLVINGKIVDADDYVYVVNYDEKTNKSTIKKLDKDLSAAYPVFYQEDSKNEGAYAQLAYDLDNDGKLDAVIFMEMDLYKVKNITNKGVYTLVQVNEAEEDADQIKVDTKDEDAAEELVILADEVAKDDYVLVYTFGRYNYIAEVLEPVIGTVVKVSNNKITLDNGDVLTFAEDATPIANGPAKTELKPSIEEVALYVVNDKIVYSDAASNIGYTPYTYAFIVSNGDKESYVDTDTGTLEIVYNLLAFVNGKAVTIPTTKDYTYDEADWEANYQHKLVTVEEIKNGKYILNKNILSVKDYETLINGANLTYDSYTKLYKLNGKIVNFDENSELYVRYNQDEQPEEDLNGNKEYGETEIYKNVKLFTKNNMPSSDFTGGQAMDVVVRLNKNAKDELESYTLVVGYATVKTGESLGAGTENFADYRIVLDSALILDTKENENYMSYKVLNPISGEITEVVDTVTIVDDNTKGPAAGTIVKFLSSSKIEKNAVSAHNAIFDGTTIVGATGMIQINKVLNDNIVTFYKGAGTVDGEDVKLTVLEGTKTEMLLNGIKVVVVTIDDNDEVTAEVTDDYSVLEGKVARIYVSDNDLKADYVVVLPYQWLIGEKADDKADDLFKNLEEYTDYEI